MTNFTELINNLYKIADKPAINYSGSFVKKAQRYKNKDAQTYKIQDPDEIKRDRLYKTGCGITTYKFSDQPNVRPNDDNIKNGGRQYRDKLFENIEQNKKCTEYQKDLNFALRQQRLQLINQSAIKFDCFNGIQESYSIIPKMNNSTLQKYIDESKPLQSNYVCAFKSQIAKTNDDSQFKHRMFRKFTNPLNDDLIKGKAPGKYFPKSRDYDLAAPWKPWNTYQQNTK